MAGNTNGSVPSLSLSLLLPPPPPLSALWLWSLLLLLPAPAPALASALWSLLLLSPAPGVVVVVPSAADSEEEEDWPAMVAWRAYFLVLYESMYTSISHYGPNKGTSFHPPTKPPSYFDPARHHPQQRLAPMLQQGHRHANVPPFPPSLAPAPAPAAAATTAAAAAEVEAAAGGALSFY